MPSTRSLAAAVALLVLPGLIGGCSDDKPLPTGNPTKTRELFELARGVEGRFSKDGYRALNDTQRTFHCVWQVMNCGSFESWYRHDASDQCLDAPDALKAVGAPGSAAIVERANALFTNGIPASTDARKQAVRALPDESRKALQTLTGQFHASGEDLGKLLLDWAAPKRAELLEGPR